MTAQKFFKDYEQMPSELNLWKNARSARTSKENLSKEKAVTLLQLNEKEKMMKQMEFDFEQVVSQKQKEIDHLKDMVDKAYQSIGAYKDSANALQQ